MQPNGSNLIRLEDVTVFAKNEGDVRIDITAPTIKGYTFRAWLQPRSQGFVTSAYIEPAMASQASVWIPDNSSVHINSAFAATALYTKD